MIQIRDQIVKVQPIPIGVKIISVLYYISGFLGLIYEIEFFVSSKLLLALKAGLLVYYLAYLTPLLTVGGVIFVGLIMVNGIILSGLSILSCLIGFGLWKKQKWARISAIILAILGALLSTGLIFFIGNLIVMYIISLIINLYIVSYLIFSTDAKSVFLK